MHLHTRTAVYKWLTAVLEAFESVVCVLPLLQDNQKDLENATEQLSEYLERDITSDMLFDIKQKVQDKSRCVVYTAYQLCSSISLSLS